jgi:hypothetical protein
LLISLVVSELYPGQIKNEKRAITKKLGKAELQFLCNALLLTEIYLSTKFLVHTSSKFQSYVPDKKSGWKKQVVTICSPFWEHKKMNVIDHNRYKL